MFLLPDTSVCSPLPSSGSPGSSPAFPTFNRYYGFVRLLPALPRRSPVSLDRRVPPWDAFCSLGRCIPNRPGPGPLLSSEPHSISGGDSKVSQVPGESLLKACPGLETPAVPGNLALTVARILPSTELTASASATMRDFGAETLTAHFLAVYASTPTSHPVNGKTRYWPASYGFDQVGLSPTGILSKGFLN